MDKYIKTFCEQNPKFDLECPNCNKKNTFKSKDVFNKKEFSFSCKNCGSHITVDTTPFIKEFQKALNSIGIFLK